MLGNSESAGNLDKNLDNFKNKKEGSEETIEVDKRNLGEQTIDYGRIHKEFTDSNYDKKKYI